jgi:hypothetical protein
VVLGRRRRQAIGVVRKDDELSITAEPLRTAVGARARAVPVALFGIPLFR